MSLIIIGIDTDLKTGTEYNLYKSLLRITTLWPRKNKNELYKCIQCVKHLRLKLDFF